MQTRRHILAASGALVLSTVRPASARERVVRVGVLPFDAASWEIKTIRRNGFDAARGLRVEPLKLDSIEAGRTAFQSGAVDAVVGDLLFATRLRAQGEPIKFLPFLSTEGAVMMPPNARIRSVQDLKGRRIGIAGGTLDKGWLLLLAYATDRFGIDLEHDSTHAYGSSPVLARELGEGEVDAALLDWTFCTRLETKGFRRLIGVGDLAKSFGVVGDLALSGYLFRQRNEPIDVLSAFAAASSDAKRLLARSDAAWVSVRPFMQAADDATYQALQRAFLAGIPNRHPEEERADAERLYARLAQIGGKDITGSQTTLPTGLYWGDSSAR